MGRVRPPELLRFSARICTKMVANPGKTHPKMSVPQEYNFFWPWPIPDSPPPRSIVRVPQGLQVGAGGGQRRWCCWGRQCWWRRRRR